QDALGGVLGEQGAQMLLTLRANQLVRISEAGTATVLPEKLIDIWLHSLATAAMGQPLRCVVVGRNAVVRVPPQAPDAAREQLQVLLATWVEGMRWPLPLPPGVALQWLKSPGNLNALADVYEGSDFKRAEKDQDPALARTYPTLQDLLATPALSRLAEAVYAPLKAWAAATDVELLPDALVDEEEGEAA
ncbi:MAG: exodeoxyribonuclease V subunit gamma, partial [Betaproteobacteria bacterium]|nr:exodeoxyribonuclease V subunit gamma [Betaproteobacteria bacterium]